MLSQLLLQRKRKKLSTCRGEEQCCSNEQYDTQYSQVCYKQPHKNLETVFTIEKSTTQISKISPYQNSQRLTRGDHRACYSEKNMNYDEPEYEEIGGVVKHSNGSDDSNVKTYELKEKVVAKNSSDPQSPHSDKYEKNAPMTKSLPPKPSLVYGMITAKEVAKFRPCTQ